jgi:hypothetical protein
MAPSTVQGVVAHRQPVARFLIHYYWLLILGSLILFLYETRGKPAFIELSFYPLYFLVGGLVKSFLEKRIASAFGELRQTGALQELASPSVAEDFQRRLNSRFGEIVGMLGGVAILWFYRNLLTIIDGRSLDFLLSIFVAVIDVLLAYAIGVATWKACVTAFEFRRLGVRGALRIRLFHPDGCAGLGAIGRVCFSLSLILVSIGLFLGGWVLYARWINPNANAEYRFFEPWFAGALIVVAVVSILAFFFPMITVHRLMQEQAANFEAQLVALAERITEWEESLLSQGSQLGHEQLEGQYAKLQFLRSIYVQRQHLPTWPIDVQIWTKFISVQIPLLLGTLGSVLSLWERLNKLLS